MKHMTHKRAKYKLTALLLAGVFAAVLFCGCGIVAPYEAESTYPAGESSSLEDKLAGQSPVQDDGAGQAAEDGEEPQELRTVHFDDMVYERPDVDRLVERLYEIIAVVGETDSFEEVDEITDEATDILMDFNTAFSLAAIHSELDKTDEYWLEEYNYVMENYAAIELCYTDLYIALYNSAFRSQIEDEWDIDYFTDFDEMDMVNETTSKLLEEEAALVAQYIENISTDTVLYGGEELSYADIWAMDDYVAMLDALELWYASYNGEYGQIYIDLVKIRQQLAAEYGYDNYVDMSFDNYASEYSASMMEEYFADVKEYIVPLYTYQVEIGFFYQPEVDMDYDDFMGFARKNLMKLSSEFGESYDYMMEYGLCDFLPSQYKVSGAATRYIANYDAPFVMGSYASDLNSIRGFFHEFGHFHNMHLYGAATGASLDTDEIFSQAVELMSINMFPYYFGGETGYMMMHDSLASVFAKIPEESFYADFEREVYLMDPDELTVDRLNSLFEQKNAEYGMDFVAIPGYVQYDWVSMTHIYEVPFYTFSYVTSVDAALQIWEQSLTDQQAAMDIFDALQEGALEYDFVENVENAGLVSPFAPGRVQELARMIEEYIIEEKLYDAMAA